MHGLGEKCVSLPAESEGLDGFSSYIPLNKTSKAFGVRQPKPHHLDGGKTYQ